MPHPDKSPQRGTKGGPTGGPPAPSSVGGVRIGSLGVGGRAGSGGVGGRNGSGGVGGRTGSFGVGGRIGSGGVGGRRGSPGGDEGPGSSGPDARTPACLGKVIRIAFSTVPRTETTAPGSVLGAMEGRQRANLLGAVPMPGRAGPASRLHGNDGRVGMPTRDLRLPKRKDEASTFDRIPGLEVTPRPLRPGVTETTRQVSSRCDSRRSGASPHCRLFQPEAGKRAVQGNRR